MDRRRVAAIAIGVVVATSAAGFVAGSRIASPAEVASRTAAPDPSLILVPVEERTLATEVVTRGTGRFGSPQKLAVPSSALKQSPGLIAALPVAGAELIEGDVVANASGRPLFLLVGARPMSRDLGPGLSGDDVRQLEDSLTRLGFDPGPIDGVYDQLTSTAVEAWYLAAGYSPFTSTDDQLAAIRAREADLAVASFDVSAASDAVTTAETALTTAQAASTTAVRRSAASVRAVDRATREADAANVVALREVTAKQAALDAVTPGHVSASASPGQVSAAEADLAAARTNEISVQAVGRKSVADAQTDLDQGPARLAAAQAAAVAADQAATADVAAKQATYDDLVADPATSDAERAVARSDLTAAQTNASTVHAAGLQAVADAAASVNRAPTALEDAHAEATAANDLAAADVAAKELALAQLLNPNPPTATEVAAAQNDLAIAVASAETVRLAGERSVEDAVITSADAADEVTAAAAAAVAAQGILANARSALTARDDIQALAAREADLANRRAGVQVPADELVFVATGPVRVSDLLVVVGDPVAGALLTVTDSVVHVDAGLALSDAGLVAAGMPVQLDEPDLGIAAEGVVALVASAPGTNGVDGFHVYVAIDVAAAPANLVGASVRLTIPVESSGTSVLAVPVSALTLAADGSSQIQRSVDGVTEFVTVTPGLSAAGFVGIAAPDQNLRAGDLVVIGVDQPAVADGNQPTGNTTGSTTEPPGGTGG